MPTTSVEKGKKRLGATAFILLLLDACGKMELNEEILHSLAYLVQSQMKASCYPRMEWMIRAGFLYSEQIKKGLWLARKQRLISQAPDVNLTTLGKRHCVLLDESVNSCRLDLTEAAVATIGLSSHRLHGLCVAAAALASGFADQVMDVEVVGILSRHAQYVTKKATLTL